jgi:dTDP-4-dehydrorhamnose reductase
MTMTINGKILITGGESMIAGAFKAMYPGDVHCPGKDELDITDASSFCSVLETGSYHTVINAAGISSKSAFAMYGINALHPYRLASACAERNIRFAMLSTSRVFGGTKETAYLESDKPDPVDDYGQSKLMGEILIQSLSWKVPYYIFRLPLVLGCRERNRNAQVVTRLIDQARSGKSLRAASDVFHSPVHVNHVVSAMMECLHKGRKAGIYHVGRGESVSLHDLVSDVLKRMGLNADVKAAKASDIDPLHLFPKHQSLSSVKITLDSTLTEDITQLVSEETKYGEGTDA